MRSDGSPFRSVPSLYPILFAYLLGIVLASRSSLPRSSLLVIMGTLFCLALISLVRLKKAGSLWLWTGSFFLLGIVALQIALYPPGHQDHVRHFATGDRVIVEGTLTRPPEQSPRRVRLYVKTHTLVRNRRVIPTRGMVLLSLPQTNESLRYGDRIRFATRLRRPTNFSNPGGFDYQRYLAARHIWATAFVKDPTQVIRVATGQGNVFRTWLEGLRDRIRDVLRTHGSDSAGPILRALILGERGAIPEEVKEEFAISGAAHILAISGLHLGIISFILFRGLLWSLRQSERITLGTSIEWQVASDVQLALDYNYVDTEAEQDMGSNPAGNLTVGDLPSVNTRLNHLQLSGTWQMRENLAVQLDYQYYRYKSDDWAWNGVQPDTIGKVLTFGQGNPNEQINYVGASVIYHWQ